MMEFVAHNLYFFYLIVLLSSIFSSSLGIGGFILIPLAAIYFGAKESVGIITVYFLFQNINKFFFFRKYIDYSIVKKMILWAMPGVILGAVLLGYVPVKFFEKMLAIVIILFIFNDVYSFIKKNKKEKSLPLFGFFYGFLSGFLGSGNLIKGPLFISLGLLKESYIGTYALTSLFMNIPKLGIYITNGIVSEKIFFMSVPFLFISIIGTYIGKRIIKYVKSTIFYLITIIFFIITALILLFK